MEEQHDSFSDIDESMDRYKKRSMIKTKQSLQHLTEEGSVPDTDQILESQENEVELPTRAENIKISNLLKKNEEKERIKKIMMEQKERERHRAS